MVTLARRVARTPFAPVVAAMFAVVAAILATAVPTWMFERAVVDSGLPTWISVAGPPLGLKARVLAVALAFLAAGGITWILATPVSRWLERDRRRRTPWRDEGYTSGEVRVSGLEGRRRPIFAPTELGAPLMSDEAITMPAPNLPPELEAPLDAAEFDTAPTAPGDAAQEESATIHDLIRRLESGMERRAANDAGSAGKGNEGYANARRHGDELRQMLGELRSLATRWSAPECTGGRHHPGRDVPGQRYRRRNVRSSAGPARAERRAPFRSVHTS